MSMKTPSITPKKIRSLILVVVAAIILVLIRHAISTLRLHDHHEVMRIMASYLYVDRIHINLGEGTDIRYGNPKFDEVKYSFYPFYKGRVFLQSSTRRWLVRISQGNIGQILYYVDGELLFSLDIFTFIENPLPPGQPSGNNVFMLNGYYAVAFVTNTNFMASFRLGAIDVRHAHYGKNFDEFYQRLPRIPLPLRQGMNRQGLDTMVISAVQSVEYLKGLISR